METRRTLQEINDEYKDILIPVILIIAVLMALGIFGNPLVIYFYGIRKKATASYMFIVALSIFDLMSCVVSMPIEILDIVYFYTFPDRHACRTLRFINYFSSIASGTTLIAIAVDRYRKICKPFEDQITIKIAKFVILFVVSFSLFSSWPSLAIYDVVTVNISEEVGMKGHDCRMLIDESYKNYIFAYQLYLFLLFFITLFVLVIIYILVGKKLFQLRSFQFYASNRRASSLRPMSGMSTTSDITANPSKRISKKEMDVSHGDANTFDDDGQVIGLSSIGEESLDNSKPTSAKSVDLSPRSSEVSLRVNKILPLVDNNENDERSAGQTRNFTESSPREKNTDNAMRPFSTTSPPVVKNIRNTSDRSSLPPATSRNSSGIRESSFESGARDAHAQEDMDVEKKRLRAQNINTRRYTIIAISISIAFIFSYLPYLILSLWTSVFVVYDPHEFSSAELVAIELFLRSFLFCSVCNPIIYGLLNSEFKEMVGNIFKTIFCCGKGVKELKSSSEQSGTS